MKILIKNIPAITSLDEINALFSRYGTVDEVRFLKDQSSAIVVMPYSFQAKRAVKILDGTKLVGQTIQVEAIE